MRSGLLLALLVFYSLNCSKSIQGTHGDKVSSSVGVSLYEQKDVAENATLLVLNQPRSKK